MARATKPKTAASTMPAVPRGLELAFDSRRESASVTGVESDWLRDISLVLAEAGVSVEAVAVTSGKVDVSRVVCVVLLEIELVGDDAVAAVGVADSGDRVPGL